MEQKVSHDDPLENGGTESNDYDAVAEKRVRSKLDWNMMPLFLVLCKCNICAFLI